LPQCRLLDPYAFRSVAKTDYAELSLDPEGQLSAINESCIMGQQTITALSARDLLEMALTQKKPDWSTNLKPYWFTDIFPAIRDLIVKVLCRGNERKESLEAHLGEWLYEVVIAAERGALYEFGIVGFNNQGKSHILTISNPYCPQGPWHKILGPQAIYAGRDDLLEILSQALNGRSLAEANLATAFNTGEEKLLLTLAREHSPIVFDSKKTKMQLNLSLADRVRAYLKQTGERSGLWRFLAKEATALEGYIITASEGDDGETELRLKFARKIEITAIPAKTKIVSETLKPEKNIQWHPVTSGYLAIDALEEKPGAGEVHLYYNNEGEPFRVSVARIIKDFRGKQRVITVDFTLDGEVTTKITDNLVGYHKLSKITSQTDILKALEEFSKLTTLATKQQEQFLLPELKAALPSMVEKAMEIIKSHLAALQNTQQQVV